MYEDNNFLMLMKYYYEEVEYQTEDNIENNPYFVYEDIVMLIHDKENNNIFGVKIEEGNNKLTLIWAVYTDIKIVDGKIKVYYR